MRTGVDFRRRAGRAGDFAQERAFAPIAFEAMDASARDVGELDGDDHAGETRAGTHVDPAPGLRRQGEKLGAVGDMAGPHLGEARLGNEIGDLSPSSEKVDIEREPGFAFPAAGERGRAPWRDRWSWRRCFT